MTEQVKQQWQPIETAPRDGTPIIGWVESTKGPTSGVMYIVWWRESRHGRWCFFESGYGDSYSVYPSLWQPLPTPPVDHQSDGEASEAVSAADGPKS